jgi:hypothetical protein
MTSLFRLKATLALAVLGLSVVSIAFADHGNSNNSGNTVTRSRARLI